MRKYRRFFFRILSMTVMIGMVFMTQPLFVMTEEAVKEPVYHMIPLENLIATAGNEEEQGTEVEGPAEFAIDGDENTWWHTKFGGWNVDEDHWIQLEIDGSYEVTGLMYLPRKHAGTLDNGRSNGVITTYQILVSDDEENWTEVGYGDWPNERGWKTVIFDPVSVKYVRLVSVNSVEDFMDKGDRLSSAAELRLLTGTQEGVEIPTPSATPTPEITPTPFPDLLEQLKSQCIPLKDLKATAGNEESRALGEGPAELVLDGDVDTLWHTDWNGWDIDEDHWIQLEVNGDYEITGLMYLPRKTAGDFGPGWSNGTISTYRILVSNDEENWMEVAYGSWPIEAGWKLATFDAVSVKYVRLMSVESFSDMYTNLGHRLSSAAELRLITGPTEGIVTPPPIETPTPTEEAKPTPTATPTPTQIPEATPSEQPTDFQVQKLFKDVYKDWYTEYVQYVYDKGLMTGIKGTRLFQPMGNVTKAQVVQVLYNMEGKPEVIDEKVFYQLKDVYKEEWYADAVAWSYNNGVITGDLNAKKFFPNQDVTREQLALMLYRYAQYRDYDTSQTSDLSGLLNVHKVANWSEDGVRWAVGTGIISGVQIEGDRDLIPQGTASRAQMAAIFARFCEGYHIKFPNYKPGIPSDAMEWQGHYYAVIDNCSTWEEAKEYCEALGGHLATITSAEEDKVLYRYVKSKGYTSAYFGLSDVEKEGTWVWVTGESMEYLNWNELEPGGKTAENYGMYFYIYEDGTWNDGAFKENIHDGGNAYICEWEN